MQRYRLTILVPTFNRDVYLRSTLNIIADMVVEQGDSLVQVLVSDNASTDSTSAVCAEFRERFEFFKIFRQDQNTGTAETNIFSALSSCEGEFVWVFGDDDVVYPGSLKAILEYILAQEPDFLMLNCGVITPTGSLLSGASLRSDLSGIFEEIWITDSRKFIRDTGLTAHITTCPALIFRRKLVLDIDWRSYTDVSPIYSHSFIFLHAFANASFHFMTKPLVGVTATQDADLRWRLLGKSTSRSMFYPWTVGLCRLLLNSVKHGVVPGSFFHDVVEVNSVERYTLAGHTLFVLIRQLVDALESERPDRLPSDDEWEDVLTVLSGGIQATATLVERLAVLRLVLRDFLQAIDTARLEDAEVGNSLGRIFGALPVPVMGMLVTELRGSLRSSLDALIHVLPWKAEEPELVDVYRGYAVFRYRGQWFASGCGPDRIRFGALGPVGDDPTLTAMSRAKLEERIRRIVSTTCPGPGKRDDVGGHMAGELSRPVRLLGG